MDFTLYLHLPVAARVGLVQQRAGTHTNPDAPKRHRAAFRPGFHPGREQHRVYNLYDYRHRGLLHHSNGGKLDSVGWRYVCYNRNVARAGSIAGAAVGAASGKVTGKLLK